MADFGGNAAAVLQGGAMEHPDGELIRIGELELRFFVTGKDTAGGLDMYEVMIPPGAGVPAPHYHVHVDEAIYVVEGSMEYTIDGHRREIGVGGRAFCPRGGVHHFKNLSHERTRAIFAMTPALIGPSFFREMGGLVNAGGPVDITRTRALMARYGLFPASEKHRIAD